MAGPRTSYGGGRSVWIRKKKKRRSYDGGVVGDDQPGAAAVSTSASTAVGIAVAASASDTCADPMNTSATTSSSSSTENDDDSSTDGSDGSDSSPATTGTTSTVSSRPTSSKLIGWDETLCRPIYELVHNQDNTNDDNHGDDGKDSDEGDDDASASSGDLSMALSLESSQESLSSVLGDEDRDESTGRGTTMTRPTSPRRSRAVRSYGTRKRGRAGLSAAAEAVLLDGEHVAAEDISERTAKRAKKETTGTSKKRVFGGRKAISNSDKASARAARTAVPSPTKTDVTVNTDESGASSMLTPQPYGNGNSGDKNICNVLDSDVQKSAVAGVGASGGDFAQAALATSDNTGMEEGQQPILDLGQQQKTKASRRQYGGKKLQPRKSTTATIDAGLSSTKSSELDFSGGGENDDDRSTKLRPKLTQPSGQSSLSAARAFFEQLDETSELSVENKDVLLSPELRRHRRGADGTIAAACIRTSRTADIDDPKLVAEYEQYCKSSDITPLPLREYVIHRNSFFNSSTTICDGLLDDN